MDAVDRAMIDRLLGIGPRMKRGYRENPLTGGAWIAGEDSVQEQRRRTKRALDAQCEYARRYPDAPQPLLTNYHEIADVKATGGLGFIQALFAQSIEGSSYDFDKHPTFDDFAAGILAQDWLGTLLTSYDPQLTERYPPKALPGLMLSGIWAEPNTIAAD